MSRLTRSLLFACACLFTTAVYLTTSTSAEKPVLQTQGPKTVEQERKNIQVIKGLPDAQLVNLMNFMASSLGVRCDHCHVTNGKDPKTGWTNWIWEGDDKPTKETARRMMRMVMSLNGSNKADFRNNVVTCFTCHRGQLKPASLPSMPLAKSGHEPDPNETTSTTASPATVAQILAKYRDAVGGSAAGETRNLVMKGQREASQSRVWRNDITWADPDKFLSAAATPQGEVRQILDGDRGWVLSGGQVRALSATEVADAKRSLNELYNVVKVKTPSDLKYGGLASIDNRDAYVLERITTARIERYYFDAQNGLLIRKNTIISTLLVPLPDQIDFLDYRDVDGVKVPFTIRYSGIDTFNSWTRTFTEIKRNSVVDDSSFAKPAEPAK